MSDVTTVKVDVNFLNDSVFKLKSNLLSHLDPLAKSSNNVSYLNMLLSDAILKHRHIRLTPIELEEIDLDEVDKISLNKINYASRKMILWFRKISKKIVNYLNINENNLAYQLFTKRNLYYYFPRRFIYDECFVGLNDKLKNLGNSDEDKKIKEKLLNNFVFPKQSAISPIVKDMNTFNLISCCEPSLPLPIISLCISHLETIHLTKNEIDPFANFKKGYNCFHYAAANEEICGLLILLEDEYLEQNTMKLFENCYTFVIKNDISKEKMIKLRDIFLTFRGNLYSEDEALKYWKTPLGMAKHYRSRDILNFYYKVISILKERFGAVDNDTNREEIRLY